VRYKQNEWVRDSMIDENAGGHLVAQLGKDGIATRLYGVSHCGTVFMVEPGKGRSVILQHLACSHVEKMNGKCPFPSISNYHRFEVGIALQTFATPLGVTTNLFVSVTKAYALRQSMSHRTHDRSHRRPEMGNNGFGESETVILKIPVESTLSSCHGFKVGRDGEIATPFTGTKALWKPTSEACFQSAQLVDSVHQAETIQYHKGALYWWNNKLNKLSLDVSLPCDQFAYALKSHSKISAISRWCSSHDDANPLECISKFTNGSTTHLVLDEGHNNKQPWAVTLYKKTVTAGAFSGSSKIVACAKPAPPTTRHSPEVCCTWKDVKAAKQPASSVERANKMKGALL